MKRHTPFAVLMMLSATACGPLGAIAYKLAPDPVQEARYKIKDRPTAILVENFRNPDMAEMDAELLARDLTDQLDQVVVDKKKLLTHLIPFQKVIDLRNSHPKDFNTMTVPAIGKAVGAEQILYIDLQASGVSPMATSAALQGKASAAVKVIEVESGDTLWPTDAADGYPVAAKTNPLEGQETSSYDNVREQLFESLSDQIARLFYKYSLDGDQQPPSKISGTD